MSNSKALNKDFAPMLAHRWNNSIDPTGLLQSEKIDGVRAIWTGTQLQTRTGYKLNAPEWFIQNLPATPLEGELSLGRGKFQQTVSIVLQHHGDWEDIQYLVFDLINFSQNFTKRYQALQQMRFDAHITVVSQTTCQGKRHLLSCLKKIENQGGEGLVLRNPSSRYQQKRSHDFLKVTTPKTAEATVIGYTSGQGRLKGVIGALQCQADNGITFKLGTGLSDKERKKPPTIGSRVTYQFFEKTNRGAPRSATYIAVRNNY